jgi:predicted nucleic acid-binding protein
VADQLGWARTYSAHYVALARLLKCPLVTIDPRVKETASGLVEVIGPQDVADLPPRDSGL